MVGKMMNVIKRLYIFAATALAVFLLVGFTASGPQFPAAACQECHQQKSQAYQKCRSIPPTDRKARNRCFATADRALKACLKSCK
jgi:hypothetical protein